MDSWKEGEGYVSYVGRWRRLLAGLFDAAGLSNVDGRPVDAPTLFADVDNLWRPFLVAQGPAPSYAASLALGDRDRVRDVLHESLPIADDGSIHLTARARAVSGVAS